MKSYFYFYTLNTHDFTRFFFLGSYLAYELYSKDVVEIVELYKQIVLPLV